MNPQHRKVLGVLLCAAAVCAASSFAAAGLKQVKAGARPTAEHDPTMPGPSQLPTPSCCAGLRPVLLHGWQQGVPLQPAPFRQMAAQSGATPHELLRNCRQLQHRGALLPLHARWGAALRRERWRLGFADGGPNWQQQLEALPGCERLELAQPAGGMVWAELEALDEAALQRQLARLPQPPLARLRLPGPQAALVCDDPALAQQMEQGLALCARPFAECAARLGRSERQLLATLNAWQRQGQLAGLVLEPPPPRAPQPGLLAQWQGLQPSRHQLARLQALPVVERLISLPPRPDWPWSLSLLLRASPALAQAQLQEHLRSVGLDKPPAQTQTLRIRQPRPAALLFDA